MVTFSDVKMKVAKDPSAPRAVAPVVATGGAPVALSGGPQGNPLFDPLYLQAAGVALMVILGSALAWWLVGMNTATVEFLIATDGEMKKVNWSAQGHHGSPGSSSSGRCFWRGAVGRRLPVLPVFKLIHAAA